MSKAWSKDRGLTVVCGRHDHPRRDECDAQESKDERMIEDEVLNSHEEVVRVKITGVASTIQTSPTGSSTYN
jgi:hypothetical protein